MGSGGVARVWSGEDFPEVRVVRKSREFVEFVRVCRRREEEVMRWAVALHKCCWCGKEQCSVYPEGLRSLECSGCGKMTAIRVVRRVKRGLRRGN